MSQQTHDPNEVALDVLGNVITQFAKGTYLTVEYDSDAFNDEVGANGDVVRVRSADQRGTMKFTLMRASPSNDVLTALARTDRLTGTGTGAVFVRDFRGTSIHHAQVAWIKRVPSATYATEAMTTEWEIRCAKLDSFVGGALSL